jgi:hypothetical protein
MAALKLKNPSKMTALEIYPGKKQDNYAKNKILTTSRLGILDTCTLKYWL